MTGKIFKGIPREQIPWYPTINYDKCIRCEKCVEFCKLGAYCLIEKDGEKKPFVSNPYNCVVLCKGCQDICPSGAISHQSKNTQVKLLLRELLGFLSTEKI